MHTSSALRYREEARRETFEYIGPFYTRGHRNSANNTVRKIDPAGEVTTVVGVAGQVSFVPGALPGLLAFPTGVAISGTSLYVAVNNGVAVVQNRP